MTGLKNTGPITPSAIGFGLPVLYFWLRKINATKMTKIGINGFGRNGRLALRAAVNRPVLRLWVLMI